MKLTQWPQIGDLAVIKIKRIMPYGAIAELIEYNNREAFIHISQISTGYVKNIRSFLSEGEMRVAQVQRMDQTKNTIDISLRNVSEQQQKRKLEDYKREKRADKLFEKMCRELKEDFKKSYPEIAMPLANEFGDLLSAFETASQHGEEAFQGINIPDKWKAHIAKLAKENITIPEVTVKGTLILSSNKGDGIEEIKNALKKAAYTKEVEIIYISAPNYQINVTAPDYKSAENILDKAVQEAVAHMKKHGGEGSFDRIKT